MRKESIGRFAAVAAAAAGAVRAPADTRPRRAGIGTGSDDRRGALAAARVPPP